MRRIVLAVWLSLPLGAAATEEVVDLASKILLEDLPPAEQAALIDDGRDRLATVGVQEVRSWQGAGDQMAAYAAFMRAQFEAGTNLHAGIQ